MNRIHVRACAVSMVLGSVACSAGVSTTTPFDAPSGSSSSSSGGRSAEVDAGATGPSPGGADASLGGSASSSGSGSSSSSGTSSGNGSGSSGAGSTSSSGSSSGRAGSSSGSGSSGSSSGRAGSSSSSGVSSSSSSGSSSGSGSGSSSGSSTASVFPSCRFHFGAIDSIATGAGASLTSQIDIFTSGWIGSGAGLPASVCKEIKPGAPLAGKVPALVSYIIAFTGRNAPGWCLADCNANNAGCAPASDLCTKGADYIRQNFTSRILPAYVSNAQSFATSCGTTTPIIWEMEPDYFQYYDAAQGGGPRGQPGGPLSGAEAANYMSQMIAAVKATLPNAVFSMDTSPWMPNNGCPGANTTTSPGWYPYFDMSQFTFINTSGGGTLANNVDIRANQDSWAGVHRCSGNKPILADTGYGAAGGSAGPDPAWDVAANINARMADGVVSITQYNPTASTWGATIASTRPALGTPIACP